MKSFISIIIPVFNSEKTIRFCLNNILKIRGNFEIIIGNDGGTDKTLNIIRAEYLHANIKILDLPHQGVSATRNSCIEKAKGDWLIFVDSDQTLSSNILDNIDSYDEVDLVLFNRATLWIKDGKSRIMAPEKLENHSFIGNQETLSFLFNYLPNTGKQNFWCTDKIFKASIIKDNDIKFPNHIDLGEDGIFVAEYLKHVNNMRVESDMYNLGVVKKGLLLEHLASKKRPITVIFQVVSECYDAVNSLALCKQNQDAKAYAENYLQDRCIRAFIWNYKRFGLEYEIIEEFVTQNIIPIFLTHDPIFIKCKDIRLFRDYLLSKGIKKTLFLSSVYDRFRSIKSKICYVTNRFFELI